MALTTLHAVNDFRKIIDRIGSENEIDVRRVLKQLLFFELSYAAADSDDRALVPLALEWSIISQNGKCFMNGLLANGAAVNDDDFGLISAWRFLHSALRKKRVHSL